MANINPEVIEQIVNAVPLDLYFLLWKACLTFFLALLVVSIIKNLSLYVRIRFSDLFSKRTVIIYDGFEGVIEEISLNGIFIKNREGITKFVPISKWYEGDIQYPNALHRHEDIK